MYEWKDDFAYMRNKVISHSKREWFLSIDADEIIQDTDEIISFFKTEEYKKFNSATITIKSLTKKSETSTYCFADMKRLFKKNKDFKYIGRIHEQPISKGPTKILKCIVNHFGYESNDKELMEKN